MTARDVKTWFTSLPIWVQFITTFGAALATLAGAVTAVPAAWDTVGLPRFAREAYVDEKIAPIRRDVGDIKQQGVEQKIETKEIRRAIVDKKRFDIDLIIKQNDQLPVILRAQLEQQMRELDIDLRDIDLELQGLRVMRDTRNGR